MKNISITPDTRSAFIVGLAVFVSLYLVVVFSTMIRSSAYVERLDESFASASAVIEFPAVVPVIDFNVSDPTQQLDDKNSLRRPLPELLEESDFGMLPARSDGDKALTPFQAYQAKVSPLARAEPYVALAIVDYGLSASLSRRAVEDLPPAVSLILTPYANEVNVWQDYARKKGHETWLQVYFETQDYPRFDLGALALLKRSSLKLNMDKLHRTMASAQGYVGLVGALDNTLSGVAPLVKAVFNSAFNRGLGYLELATPNEVVETLAAAYNAPYMQGAVVVNRFEDLALVLKAAKGNGRAVGVINATPALMDQLPDWIDSLRDAGVSLVPVSSLYRL